MTMVPAQNLSKPQHIFYAAAGCAAAVTGYTDVMTRLPDGRGYGYVNNNTTNSSATTSNDEANPIVNNHNNNCLLGSDLGIGPSHNNIANIMADDDQEEHSRTSNSITSINEAAASSTSNKDHTPTPPDHHHHHHGEGSSWLQLGLGGDTLAKSLCPPHQHYHHHHHHHLDKGQAESMAQMGGGNTGLMLELNLGGRASSSSLHNQQQVHQLQATSFIMPEFRVPQRPTVDFGISNMYAGSHHVSSASATTYLSPHIHPHTQLLSDHHQMMGWGMFNSGFNINHHRTQPTTTFLAAAATMAAASSSISPSSSSSAPPVQPGQGGPFFTRPFTASGSSSVASEFRLIHPPPRRPHSGIWFMLQASVHQAKEPFLPQVSKSFLRIKDGGMTVRLVMKYLANKLGLDSESQVEIRCRGEVLVPFLTLQHVRDQIWSPRDAVTLLSDSSTSDHVMVLHYGRSTSST